MSGADKPYYNHDSIWQSRLEQGKPIWGCNSERVYAGLIALLRDIPIPEHTILDVGCGAGLFGVRLTEQGYSYVGVDQSSVAIALGRQAYLPRENMELHCFDFANELLPAIYLNRFPIVTSVNALHCLIEEVHRRRFLENLRAALATGGRLLLTTMCGPPMPGFKPSKKPRAYLERDVILEELRQAGFDQVLFSNYEPPVGKALIPNLTVVCGRD